MKNEEEKYVLLQTKVSPDFARKFRKICKAKGINTYRALQMMAETFVRYTDDRHNLSPTMERMMAVFEHLDGWENAFNFADYTTDPNIEEAIYLLTAEGKNGCRAVMVNKPYFGHWNETTNIQQIMERVIEVLCPERYRRLRGLAIDMECGSILELIDVMVDAHTVEQLNAEFRKPFEDNNRHDYGKPVEYGKRTRRKPKVDMEKQQTIRFTEEDRQLADDEVRNDNDGEEIRPHGYEW